MRVYDLTGRKATVTGGARFIARAGLPDDGGPGM
jgi:hypothetical protein